MAATNAKKLQSISAAAAARQQRRRERLAALGRPDTAVCDRALVEALAFVLASTWTTSVGAASISVSTLAETAVSILVDREGYNRSESAKALKLRLQLREEHLDPSYIPSLTPEPILQAERMAIARDAREMLGVSSS